MQLAVNVTIARSNGAARHVPGDDDELLCLEIF
jgi:hypothetical protein